MATVFKRNIGGVAVQTISALAGTTLNEAVVQDHLGSVVSLYSNATEPLPAANQMDYGPFGTRRLVSNPEQYGPGLVVTATDKGFTGHAMLDQLGVIHMGGRIYDPLQMRFMQADPFVQDPLSAQSYNRYLYLWNNPLNGTDPTGYLGVKERQWLGTIVAIVGVAFGQPYMVGWTGPQIAAYYAIVGGVSGGITTGSWNGALQGAFTSTITAGVGGAGMPLPQQALANAFVGGAVSAMQGGKFGHGFVSAGLGTLAGPAINARVSSPGGQIVAHALVGGSISAVTGGKFANGAVTAAMGFAFTSRFGGEDATEVSGSGDVKESLISADDVQDVAYREVWDSDYISANKVVGAEMALFAQNEGPELCTSACPIKRIGHLGLRESGFAFSIQTIRSNVACGNSLNCGNMTAVRSLHVHGSRQFRVTKLDAQLNPNLAGFVGKYKTQDVNNFSTTDRSLPSNLLYAPKFGLRYWDGQVQRVIDYGF